MRLGGWKVGNRRQNTPKIHQKRGPKKCFRGRQVGAFSVFGEGVYRNPVHFLAKKGLKIGKLTDLGVDVI